MSQTPLSPDPSNQQSTAIRSSLESGLRTIFWIGAVTMGMSCLLIPTVPGIAIGAEMPSQKAVAEASPAS